MLHQGAIGGGPHVGSEFTYTRITSLLTPPVLRLFVLPASTYQSALLSSPTVSERFLPRGPQRGFNATCDERWNTLRRLDRLGCALPHRLGAA